MYISSLKCAGHLGSSLYAFHGIYMHEYCTNNQEFQNIYMNVHPETLHTLNRHDHAWLMIMLFFPLSTSVREEPINTQAPEFTRCSTAYK